MNDKTDQRSWHLSKSVPITVLVAFVGQTFMFGWWASRLEMSIDHNKTTIAKHISNKSEHMPFEEKIKVFVPRVELDNRLMSIERTVKDTKDQQVEMGKDIKEILRKAR